MGWTYYDACLKRASAGGQLQWRGGVCFRYSPINIENDVCVLINSQGIIFHLFSDCDVAWTFWADAQTSLKRGNKTELELNWNVKLFKTKEAVERWEKWNKQQTHLIATATRIMIIPTETMAMMTPQIMYQTLFGSSAINQKNRNETEQSMASLSYQRDKRWTQFMSRRVTDFCSAGCGIIFPRG